jgi:hypothetical protein
MNKPQLTTIVEDGKFVGLITKNGEIIFKTSPQDTPNQASTLMTEFIRETSGQPLPPRNTTSQPLPGVSTQPPEGSAIPTQPAPRKCCGRQ